VTLFFVCFVFFVLAVGNVQLDTRLLCQMYVSLVESCRTPDGTYGSRAGPLYAAAVPDVGHRTLGPCTIFGSRSGRS
jgi:hypothetical protein